jgi:peptide/nickel transport system substrate-binding protein
MERIELDPKNPAVFYMISKNLDYRFNNIQELSPLPAHLEGPIWEKTKNTSGAYEKESLYTTKPTTPGLYYGPYQVHEVKLGSHITLKVNPHWTKNNPSLSTIILKVIPNNQALDAALMTGQIDLITEIGTSMDQCIAFEERVKKDSDLAKKVTIVYKEGILLGQLTLNMDHPILTDKRVRQAIQLGIDRQKLIDALFKGKATISHQFFSPRDSLYDAQLPPITYQPQEAEKLLDEAQWKKGSGGIRMKDGKSLKLQLLAANGVKSLEIAQQFIQAELRKIGMEISLKAEPARVYFGETLQKRSYQGIALFSWISNPYDIPSTLFLSNSIPTKENSWSGQNVGAWNNPKADELLTQASQEIDEKKRISLMASFNKIYREEVPQIPLYHRPDCAIVPRALKGFKLYGTITKSNLNMHEWSWE